MKTYSMKTLSGCLYSHWAMCASYRLKSIACNSRDSWDGKEESRDAERVTSVGQMKNFMHEVLSE